MAITAEFFWDQFEGKTKRNTAEIFGLSIHAVEHQNDYALKGSR
jgi:hypothetical protein